MPSFAKEKIKRYTLTAALAAVVITIPLYNNLNSIALIFFVFACIIQQPLKESLKALSDSKLWIFPVVYFFWLACSYFWDVTGGYSSKDIERYALMLFVPPALALLPRLSSKQLKQTCFLFTSITIIVSVVCLYKSYIEYSSAHDSRVFYYHYLSMQAGLNAIFLSCYCLSSITWLLYYTYINKRNHPWQMYVLAAIANVFLFVMIILLSSKFIIFFALITLMFFIIYIGYLRNYLLHAFIVVAFMITGGIYAVKNLSYLSWRINVTEFKKYGGEQDNQNGIAIRVLMWQTAMEMIKERPVLGYGVRGARKTILEKYKEKNFVLGYTQGYHSHSQYLESALMGGIPALILLVGMLASAMRRAVSGRNLLLLQILLLFITQSIVESAFEVQQEFVFYIFFIFLFAYHPPPKVNLQP